LATASDVDTRGTSSIIGLSLPNRFGGSETSLVKTTDEYHHHISFRGWTTPLQVGWPLINAEARGKLMEFGFPTPTQHNIRVNRRLSAANQSKTDSSGTTPMKSTLDRIPETLLLGPGPSCVSKEVRQALAQHTFGHSDESENVMRLLEALEKQIPANNSLREPESLRLL
jgi:hypothetical protein